MANTAHVHSLVTLPSGLKARAHICGMAEHVNTLAWAVAPLAHVEWAIMEGEPIHISLIITVVLSLWLIWQIHTFEE